jgi:hypothetical protein
MRSNWMMIFVIAIIPLAFSFNFFNKSKPRDYADIAREIRGKVGNKLAKKHQMDFIGVGGGMMGSVYMLGLSFQIHHPLDRNEARERIIDCVEELLTAINSNEEIRSFLKDYPFTTKNVRIAIFSISKNGQPAFDPFITVVSFDQSDYITFRTKEPNKIPYKHRHKELYSDAMVMLNRKIESEKQ